MICTCSHVTGCECHLKGLGCAANRLTLSEDGQFVECRNNATLCYTVHIGGQLHDAVARGREYLRKWSVEEPEVSKELKARMDANDSLMTRLAFAKF